MGWTRALHFKDWAKTQDSRHLLPLLIRRLVRASTTREASVLFPAIEQVGRPGPDGIVRVSVGNQFVPEGDSLWEMGVTEDCKGKADEDIEKRNKEFSDLSERARMTFVFVTPREWQKKSEWVEAAQAFGWKNVVALDANDLEHWIERCQSVDSWFSTVTGRRPPGVVDLHSRWDALSRIAEHSLTPEVFLASREEECDQLLTYLKDAPCSITLRCESIEGGMDVLSALTASRVEEHRILENVVSISDVEGWRQLSVQNDPMILVAASSISLGAEDIAGAVHSGHHVIVVANSQIGDPSRSVALKGQQLHRQIESLTRCGFTPSEAESKAKASSGSSSVLKRLLTTHPQTRYPVWARDENRAQLAPLALVGAWMHVDPDQPSENRRWTRTYLDLPCIIELLGISKEELEARVARWSECDEPLFLRFEDSVVLSSREDAWYLLGSAITPSVLKRFENLAKLILEEDNPAYELDPQDRWFAAIHGKSHLLSDQIRQGVLETLVLMSVYPTDRNSQATQMFRATVDRVLDHALPLGAKWQRWATFSKHFSLFAEASPELFLSRLEADLDSDDPQLAYLFTDDRPGPFSSSLHCGLLWSLELLSWSPEFLPRSSRILARLVGLEHLIAKNMSNRPSRSLHTIFSWWHPQTMAPVQERTSHLRSMITAYPESMWKVIVGLLPVGGQLIGSFSCFPRWRTWADEWTPAFGRSTGHTSLNQTATLAIDVAGTCPRKWSQLLDRIFNCSPEVTQIARVELSKVPDSQSTTTDRSILWEELRQLVARHLSYPDSNWRFPDETLKFLAGIRDQLTPSDPVDLHTWLFDYRPDFEGSSKFEDRGRYEEELTIRQVAALSEIASKQGYAGVMQLLARAKNHHVIGWLLGKHRMLSVPEFDVPRMAMSNNESHRAFAATLIAAEYSNRGFAFLLEVWFRQCDPNQAGAVLSNLPFERPTWEWIKTHTTNEIRDAYWNVCRGWVLNGESADLEYAINQLLIVKRAFTATDILQSSLSKTEATTELMLRVLESGLSRDSNSDPLEKMDSYAIQELIGTLQGTSNVDTGRLSMIEWGYLPLLDSHSTHVEPVTLLAELQNSPELYIELLSTTFKAKSDPPGVLPLNEWQLHQAKNSHALLNKFVRVPGTDANGTVDLAVLRDWMHKARELAKSYDREEIADEQVGELLGRSSFTRHSPAVLTVLDEIDSEDILRGYQLAISNSRGVTCRDPYDGGKQEHELALQCATYAEEYRLLYPRVSATWKRLSVRYKEDAARMDMEVERMKVGR